MKNSFNLEVSFSKSPAYPYEWTSTSVITHVGVVRVSSELLKNVLLYEGRLEMTGTVLLSDAKNAVALRLDEKGRIVARSFLKFGDELDVAEYAANLKVSEIGHEFTEEKVPYERGLSIESEMKKFLIERIANCADENFSKYLYYLYFNRVNDYSREKLLESIETSSIDKNMKLYKFLIES